MRRSRPVKSLAERFEAKFIPEPNSGCWLWVGFVNAHGYGQIALGRREDKRALAHRASWLLHHDEDPGDSMVCHRCDNPACVNPDHLFLGDQSANMRDCAAKGRVNRTIMPRGERHGNAKLTEGAVRKIRGTVGQTAVLARELGVSLTVIKLARKGATWSHVK